MVWLAMISVEKRVQFLRRDYHGEKDEIEKLFIGWSLGEPITSILLVELFACGSQIKFEGPRGARLMSQIPVRICNMIGQKRK